MADENVGEIVLRYRTEGTTEVLRANEQLRQAEAALAKEAVRPSDPAKYVQQYAQNAEIAYREANAAQQRLNEGIAQELELRRRGEMGYNRISTTARELTYAVEETARAVDDTTAAIERQERAFNDVANAQKRQGTGLRAGAEGFDRAGSVSSQILSGLGSSEAANAAGLIGDVSGALADLTPIGLATTAVMGGLTLAISKIQEQAAATQAAIEAEITRRIELARLIASGATTGALEERARLQQADVDAQRAAIAELRVIQQERDALYNDLTSHTPQSFEQSFDELRQRFRDLVNDPGAQVGRSVTYDPLANALGEAEKQLTTYQNALDATNTAIDAGAASLNDMAAASREAAEANRQAAEDQIQREIQLAELRASGSSEQVQGLIRNAEIERQIRQAALNDAQRDLRRSGETSSPAADELRGRIGELDEYIRELSTSVTPVIQAREDETAAIQAQIAAGREAADQVRLQAEIANLSSEAARQRLEAIKTENAATQANIDELESVSNRSDEANQELQRLRDTLGSNAAEADLLQAALRGVIAAREREVEAAKKQEEAEREAAQQAQRRNGELARSLQTLATSAQRIVEIRSDAVTREAELIENAERERLRSLEAHQVAQTRAVEDAQREINRIIRDANREQIDSVADRDVESYRRSKQNEQDKLEDEQSQTRIEAQRRAEDFRRQEAERQQNARRQLEQQRASANAALQQEQAKVEAELRLQAAGGQQSITLQQQAIQARLSLENAGWSSSLQLIRSFFDEINRAANVSLKGQHGPKLTYSPTPTVAQAGATGTGVTINITGASPRDVVNQTLQVLNRHLIAED